MSDRLRSGGKPPRLSCIRCLRHNGTRQKCEMRRHAEGLLAAAGLRVVSGMFDCQRRLAVNCHPGTKCTWLQCCRQTPRCMTRSPSRIRLLTLRYCGCDSPSAFSLYAIATDNWSNCVYDSFKQMFYVAAVKYIRPENCFKQRFRLDTMKVAFINRIYG